MKLGIALRNMGLESQPETLLACARAAEAAGLDAAWVVDHLAIPPDDAEGSGGRYLDPLACLAFLAGQTSRIGLGTAVLVLPYRPALPTAKWVATIQELSGERLRLGVGVGWMRAEFRALGVDRRRRGALTDEVLELLGRCFAADEVEANGQPFLFLPRPARPPIYVGGAGPHALARALRYADGWMPMARDAGSLAEPVAALRKAAAEAGRAVPEVVVMTALPLESRDAAAQRVAEFARAGATQIVHAGRYGDSESFARTAELLGGLGA